MSDLDDQVPLIYTSKGNLPVDNLTYRTQWEFDAQGITFIEEYHLDAELVKRSAHRFQFPEGTELNLNQGAING